MSLNYFIMQTSQFQKDKLELIEQIILLNDKSTLNDLKEIFKSKNQYKLSSEEMNVVRENTQNYLSGNDKGKSWNEVKSNIISKRVV